MNTFFIEIVIRLTCGANCEIAPESRFVTGSNLFLMRTISRIYYTHRAELLTIGARVLHCSGAWLIHFCWSNIQTKIYRQIDWKTRPFEISMLVGNYGKLHSGTSLLSEQYCWKDILTKVEFLEVEVVLRCCALEGVYHLHVSKCNLFTPRVLTCNVGGITLKPL